MKQRVFIFVSVFLYFIFIFLVGKIFFTLMNTAVGGDVTASDVVSILYHGLPLDLSMSGYLTALPGFLLLASVWIKPSITTKIFNAYFAVFLSLIVIITVIDIIVYPYWGFHFDSTVFLYLQNPKEVFASVSWWQVLFGFVATIIFVLITYWGYALFIGKQLQVLRVPKSIWKTAVVLFLLTGALFLPIRGGVTVSTMNVGQAYFTDRMFLNHAAINPEFNLMYSFFKSDDFASQYQFYPEEEAVSIFKELNNQPQNDSIPQLLNTDRPNILLFVLESFSADVALDSVIAPNMSRFAKEGILFDHFYANSFRTDRGLVSVLSGYPAHPTVAIMKYPQKTENLPTIPRSLKDAGYKDLAFYYGGDADFANMRSYFIGACGIKEVVSDKDFPLNERMTKWGAPDKFLTDRVLRDLTTKSHEEPFVKTILTLSSHEPFDVPVTKFDVPFLNAVSYTDECLGHFVEQYKKTDLWKNTLIMFIADHAMQSYPQGIDNNDPHRFHIPMVWIGGAVKSPKVVSDYASQNDLAATLLSQLKIDHSKFVFSKDVLNPDAHKFAFYSYVNGFTMMDTTGIVTYDNDKRSIIRQKGDSSLEKKSKAFFQNMYLDLGKR